MNSYHSNTVVLMHVSTTVYVMQEEINYLGFRAKRWVQLFVIAFECPFLNSLGKWPFPASSATLDGSKGCFGLRAEP